MLSNWLVGAGVAVVVGLSAYGLHSFSVNRLEAKHAKAIEKQATALNSQCATAKAITSKVSYDFQNDSLVLGSEFARLDSLYGCPLSLPVQPAGAALGRNDAPARQEPVDRAGGNLERRRILAVVAKGERYRIQLKACQAFVKAAEGVYNGKEAATAQ